MQGSFDIVMLTVVNSVQKCRHLAGVFNFFDTLIISADHLISNDILLHYQSYSGMYRHGRIYCVMMTSQGLGYVPQIVIFVRQEWPSSGVIGGVSQIFFFVVSQTGQVQAFFHSRLYVFKGNCYHLRLPYTLEKPKLVQKKFPKVGGLRDDLSCKKKLRKTLWKSCIY